MTLTSAPKPLQWTLIVVALMTALVGAWELYSTSQGYASAMALLVDNRAPSTWDIASCERERVAPLLTASLEDLTPDETIGVWGMAEPCNAFTSMWRKCVGIGAWFAAVALVGLASLALASVPRWQRAGAYFGLTLGTLSLALAGGRALIVLALLSDRVLMAYFVLPLPNAEPLSLSTLLRSEPALLLSALGVGACVLLGIVRGVLLARRGAEARAS